MKKSRFTEAQIVSILREVDGCTPGTEIARKHVVHANTIRLRREKYGGLETSDLVGLLDIRRGEYQLRSCGYGGTFPAWAVPEHVTHQMQLAAPPTCTGELLADRLDQAGVVVGNDEVDAAC